ncbi:MAG: hypothetical protein COA79_03810 [Planctomycetota bacterium]|nr:MAG: hypothetical protein COA79_03810 [Planctomycetota bacterium]
MKYLLISLIAIFITSSPLLSQEEDAYYNVVQKKPFKGLELFEAWHSKVPFHAPKIIWSTWNSVILQSTDNTKTLVSIKKNSGVVRWVNKIGFKLEKIPTENKDGLYILYKNVIYILDPRKGGLMSKRTLNYAIAGNVIAGQFSLYSWEWGKKIHMLQTDGDYRYGWAVKVPNEIHAGATPTLRLDYIYIPSPKGLLYCYNSLGIKKWEFSNKPIFDDLEYFGSAIDQVDNQIRKERKENASLKIIKKLKKKRDVFDSLIDQAIDRKKGKYLAPPAFYKHNMYIGSTEGTLCALNLYSGGPLWQYHAGEPVIGEIIALEELIIFFSKKNGATAIKRDPIETELKWKIADAKTAVNITHKHIYFLTFKDELLCVDRKFGQIKWKWKVPQNLTVVKDLYSDALIISNSKMKDGNFTVHALTENGNYPKVIDYQLLKSVGYNHYDSIEKAKEEKIKKELEKAKAILEKKNGKKKK